MKRRLEPCRHKPNCVSSDATDRRHRIAPLTLAMPPEQAWPLVETVLASWPRTTIVTADDRYLHATCQTKLMRFTDDLELLLVDDETVAVRSASRVGYYDLGLNRARVEALRKALRTRGVVR